MKVKGIVFGAGKSFFETDVLKQISEKVNAGLMDDYIFGVSDRIAEYVIGAGITPENSNFVMVTQEDFVHHVSKSRLEIFKDFEKFYFNPKVLTYQYNKKLSIWYSTTSDPELYELLKRYFSNVNQFYRNQATGQTKRENIICPRFECSNVGFAAYQILRTVCGCNQIAFLGLDFIAYEKDRHPNSDKWIAEGNLTLAQMIPYRDEIAHFNLSTSGLFFDSPQLLNCTIDQYMTDNYDIPKQELMPTQW